MSLLELVEPKITQLHCTEIWCRYYLPPKSVANNFSLALPAGQISLLTTLVHKVSHCKKMPFSLKKANMAASALSEFHLMGFLKGPVHPRIKNSCFSSDL